MVRKPPVLFLIATGRFAPAPRPPTGASLCSYAVYLRPVDTVPLRHGHAPLLCPGTARSCASSSLQKSCE